jgi:hypothetical protein
LSDQDVAWSFSAGYRFNRFFGVEAGYVDLGHFSASLTGRSNAPDAHADMIFSARGGTVAAVGTFPFGNWEAYLRGGVLFANTHITVSGSNDTVSIDDRVSAETAHALAGAGLGYNVDAHWRAQIGITGYFHVGSNVGGNGRGYISLPKQPVTALPDPTLPMATHCANHSPPRSCQSPRRRNIFGKRRSQSRHWLVCTTRLHPLH